MKERIHMKKKSIAIGVVFSLTVLVGLFLVMNSQVKGDNSDAVAAVTQLENDSVKADLASDASWTKSNVADNFIGGSSFGEWQTKAQALKDIEDTAKNKTNTETMSDLKVTAYGKTAVARYTSTYDSMYHGEHRARSVICSDTWLTMGGAWKEVSSHCSQAGK
jgi:Domain of unknown function (DUF4440)